MPAPPQDSLRQVHNLYMKLDLDMAKNTERQEQITQTHARCVLITAVISFRSKVSINQIILLYIHMRTGITSNLCGVFDKTDVK